jgi:protein involved in polysaccharide export with SLBB domain
MTVQINHIFWFSSRLRSSQPARVASLVLLLSVVLSGCAALTNPVANGIPVHILPDDLLAESREGFETIPLTSLRRTPPEKYILASGDTLGIYIEGVLGSAESPPPVNVPDSAELPPSIGYPFPIRQDGTISLPYVQPVKVAGMTIEEAEQAVINAYVQKEILRQEDRRILVTLMRPRRIRVLVIRDDSQQRQVTLQTESLLGLGSSQTQIGGGRQGVGMVLELPAYENDVLNALTRSGGLPGLESTQEVTIQRGYWDGQAETAGAGLCYPSEADLGSSTEAKRHILRIPMRIRAGEQLPFGPKDIVLEDGDIVMVRARQPQFYYTGGLLPSQEIPLPNDYDLTAVEAVLKVRGPLINGALNSSNISGAVIQSGLGNPSPSLLSVLRQTPGGGQVTIRVDINEALRDPRENLLIQAGDVLVLQETQDEAITRYLTQTIRFNFFGRFINRTNAQASVNIVAP